MSTRSQSTRRRSARVRDAQSASGDEAANGSPKMNGNGSSHANVELSEDEERENIFLFWPNIIG
jgi:hypothetical protein